MRIKSQTDFWCGILFVLVGVAFVVLAHEYPMGSSERMGPGYFPTILGGLLALMGLSLGIPALARPGPELPGIRWRPLILVLAAIAVFGLLVRDFGLAIAVAAVVIVGGLADPTLPWRQALALALFLAVFSLVIFIVLLGLPLPMWPWG